jgi:hypothetical protein
MMETSAWIVPNPAVLTLDTRETTAMDPLLLTLLVFSMAYLASYRHLGLLNRQTLPDTESVQLPPRRRFLRGRLRGSPVEFRPAIRAAEPGNSSSQADPMWDIWIDA